MQAKISINYYTLFASRRAAHCQLNASCCSSCRPYSTRNNINYYQAKKQMDARTQAMNHFDNYYSKIYGSRWSSIRIALLSPHKYVAAINPFCENTEEIEKQMRLMRKVDLTRYYNKHWKQVERYKLRMQIVQKRKENKRKAAEMTNIPLSDSDVDEHISESEYRARSLEQGMTSAAEDAHRLFESEFEGMNSDQGRFLNSASTNLNLNDFVPVSELKYHEDEPFVSNKNMEQLGDLAKLEIGFQDEPKLTFPGSIRCYINPRGVIGFQDISLSEHDADDKDESDEDSESDEEAEDSTYRTKKNAPTKIKETEILCFPAPCLDLNLNLWNYYVMDAASILPMLCLAIRPDDVIADFCAAPGGKALSMLFSLMPSQSLLNEPNQSRYTRLRGVIGGYIPKSSSIHAGIQFLQQDARTLIRPDSFDKILVDAPCSNDRISVNSNDSNLFSNTRMKERVDLPNKQASILLAALKSVRVDGSVVYSTCSLSPMQNDNVVHTALTQIILLTDGKMQFEVRRLKEALRPLKGIYKIKSFQFGEQVIPFLPSNAGPLYISKIQRIK